MARLDRSGVNMVGNGIHASPGDTIGPMSALFYDDNVIRTVAAAAAGSASSPQRHHYAPHNSNVFAFNAELHNRSW